EDALSRERAKAGRTPEAVGARAALHDLRGARSRGYPRVEREEPDPAGDRPEDAVGIAMADDLVVPALASLPRAERDVGAAALVLVPEELLDARGERLSLLAEDARRRAVAEPPRELGRRAVLEHHERVGVGALDAAIGE